MTSSQWVPIVMCLIGALMCVFVNHIELAGLGLMIWAGANRIAWSIEDGR